MSRIALCSIVLASSVAYANPKLPAAGDTLAVNGADGWAAPQWMYDVPSMTDSAGKVVIHWFCAPRVAGCTDDLARITTLKETLPNVYIIAYINGSKADAKKLDPIRESEGVGRGTVGFGPSMAKNFKNLGITTPVSLVVNVDNKVQLVTMGSSAGDLDARDAKVKALVAGIKLHTSVVAGPKGPIKADTKFDLTMTITLASWLVYSKKPGTTLEYKATVPTDIKCDNTSLKGDQLKPSSQTLTVKMSCSGPKGSYEAAAQIQFAYDVPSGATGIGADGGKWKFEIVAP
jgi:hypothetical protein